MDNVIDKIFELAGPNGKGLSRVLASYAARCVSFVHYHRAWQIPHLPYP